MSVDIIPCKGTEMDVPNVSWAFLLEVAKLAGWIPSGTLAPADYAEPNPWDGCYDPVMGQLVSALDAAALGHALKRVLASDRMHKILSNAAESLTCQIRNAGYTDSPSVKVTGKTVRMVEDFAELSLASGGFHVE